LWRYRTLRGVDLTGCRPDKVEYLNLETTSASWRLSGANSHWSGEIHRG
jgi:hypothetical protein